MMRLRDRSGALAAVGLIACLAAWPGCSRKRGVEIYQDGETTVVHNPETPSPVPGGPSRLTLREDLVIGKGAGPDAELFGSLNGVGVDDDGNIWALDRKLARVCVFDRNGGPVRSFGRMGLGPGELESPWGMFVRGDGMSAVLDRVARRVVFYDRQGRHLRTVSTTMPPQLGLKINSDGIPYGVAFKRRSVKTWGNRLYKYDADMNPVQEIVAFEQPSAPEDLHAFERYIHFHVTSDDRLIWMITPKYEFRVLDPEGREIRRIVKDFRPVRITAEARHALAEELTGGESLPSGFRIVIPGSYPPVDRFIGDEDGRLFVRTYESDGRGGVWWDAFDIDGRCVARFLFPENERAIAVKKGKLYAILEEDDDGSPLLKRYALDWK